MNLEYELNNIKINSFQIVSKSIFYANLSNVSNEHISKFEEFPEFNEKVPIFYLFTNKLLWYSCSKLKKSFKWKLFQKQTYNFFEFGFKRLNYMSFMTSYQTQTKNQIQLKSNREIEFQTVCTVTV